MARLSTVLKTHLWAILLLFVGSVCIAAYSVYALEARSDILRVCAEAGNKPLCYSNEIERILRERGVPQAFDALARAYDHDPAFAATCHAVTHDLGKAAYEEFHRTGDTELTSKASYCGYGFYHGFLDELLIETNDLDEARRFCTYVGQNVPHPPEPEFAEGSCYHGIGHGITDGTDPSLWGNELTIVRPGLVLCARVADGNETWQSRCSSGVFNALGNMYLDPKFDLHPSTDPYRLCRESGFSVVDADACYNQMNTRVADLSHGDLAQMIAYPRTIKNRRFRLSALSESVAFYVQLLKRQQKNLTVADANMCDLSVGDDANTCIRGLVSGVYEFGSPGKQYDEAMLVCEDPGLSPLLRESCFDQALSLAHYFYQPDLVERICDRAHKSDIACRV